MKHALIAAACAATLGLGALQAKAASIVDTADTGHAGQGR